MLSEQYNLNKGKQGVQHTPLIIIGILFFVFGFISWLNAVLIPYFKLICGLSLQESMLVAFSFYISYFVMAIPSSSLLRRTGFKKGMAVGLVIMAVGALIFIPAAIVRSYLLFLVGLFIQATGLTILQTASNPYVTILGPMESAATRICIMGVSNKLAGVIAPLALIHSITRHSNEIDELQRQLPTLAPTQYKIVLDDLSGRLILPYLAIAATLLILSLVIRFSGLPDIEEAAALTGPKKRGILQFPHLVLGAVAVFCAVSVEVLAVDSIISYAQYNGLPFATAKYFASYTLAIMIFCYLMGTVAIPKYIQQREALMLSAVTGVIVTVTAIFIQGYWSIWCIALLGLANALLWPSIWPLSMDGLGDYTKKGAALLIMGVIGGALTPLLYGMLGGITNPQLAYGIMIPFYLFILYYSLAGWKRGKGPGYVYVKQ